MAEGFLKSFDKNLEAYSAGTKPTLKVHPKAIQVMSELGIDLSNNKPKSVAQFLNQPFDYVITVCDGAKESCPMFTGSVKHRIHIGFEDPADTIGTDAEITSEFRKIRDEIEQRFNSFYLKNLITKNESF